MFGGVCLFVCLSVCLSAILRKRLLLSSLKFQNRWTGSVIMPNGFGVMPLHFGDTSMAYKWKLLKPVKNSSRLTGNALL